jgi:eukaryotic-like serine/threonine-protein kinase
MSGEADEGPDHRLAEAMASYDDLLAVGGPSVPEVIPETVDPSLLPEWNRVAAFLTLVERAWPRAAPAPDHQTLPAGTDTGPDAAPEASGSAGQFGRFQIVRTLGQGGFGIVFLAWDPSLRRQVALKVPQPEALVTPEARKRFLREAHAAAGLDHPNIVAVHEAGSVGTVAYIASAYCPGPTLAQWLSHQTQPVPPRDAAGLVAMLARAVDHAHQRGVLHRDLKPSNVLLQRPGTREPGHEEDDALVDLQPRITDFSLAWLADGEGPKTLSGVPLGSPPYMAPEQAEGRLKVIGPPTDVYGLGCILYELLAGHPPFRGDSQVEILRQVIAEDPPAPRRLRKDLPVALEAIVLKCLTKAPAGRYPTARELADDLDRFLAGEPTRARPAVGWRRLRRAVRRHPVALAVLAIVAISVLALLAGVRWYESRLEVARRLSQQKEEATRARDQEIRRHREYVQAIRQADQLIREFQASSALEILLRQCPQPGEEDLRDFAWHLLMRRCHSERGTLSGHRGDVYFVEFSPRGDLLASAGKDGTVRIWDTTSWRQVRQIVASPKEVNVATFSPDGKSLATVDDDGKLKLWDVATGRPDWEMLAHQGDAVIARFTSDGRKVITGGRTDHLVRIWDRSRGVMIDALPFIDLTRRGGHLENAVISPDGSILAIAGIGPVRLWNLAKGTLTTELPGTQGAQGVAFSHDGTRLATCHEGDWSVRLWGIADRRLLHEFRGHASGVFSVVFSRDGQTLISAGDDGTIRFWSVTGGHQLGVHQGHKSRIWNLVLSPDGRTLASAGADGAVKIWSAMSPMDDPRLPISNPGDMAFSKDGRTLLTVEGSQPYSLKLWDTYSGALKDLRFLDVPSVRTSLFSRDGRLVAIKQNDGAITFWNSENGHPCGRTDLLPAEKHLVAFSPSLRYLMIHHTVTGPWIWDLVGRRWLHIGWEGLQTLGFAPSEGVAMVRDDRLDWWDPDTGRTKSRAFITPHRTSELAFSLDDQLMVGMDRDVRRIRVWSVQTLDQLQEIPGPPVGGVTFDFSPDGKTLACGGADRMVKLFDVLTGEEELALAGYGGSVNRVLFAPDGRSLATISSSGQSKVIALWRTAQDEKTPAAPAVDQGVSVAH